MNPDELVSLGNVRRDLGDLSSLLLSIDRLGVLVPVVTYRQGEQVVIWEGHRRIRCAQIVNLTWSYRTTHSETYSEPKALHKFLSERGLLDSASVSLDALDQVGHNEPIRDVVTVERDKPKTDSAAIQFQLLSNDSDLRRNLNPMDEAVALTTLLASKPIKAVAEMVSKSESYVSRRSRLVELHPDFQEAVRKGDLAPRAAEELLTLDKGADEVLRKSLIGAKTTRAIKRQVTAANAAIQNKRQEPIRVTESLGQDPLTALGNLLAQEAVVILNRLHSSVTEDVDLTRVKEAAKWLE